MKTSKNIYLDFKKFVKEQIMMNPEADLNPDWDAWQIFFLISKLKGVV